MSAVGGGAARNAALAWLGACVLMVLLAGGALAAERACVAAVDRVEAVERPAIRAVAPAMPAAERPAASCAARERPRAVPRTRSVSSRGLPPPRAPTA